MGGLLVVAVFIDRNVISEQRTKKEKHCCQIAKIQQTHIKVQSHKIAITFVTFGTARKGLGGLGPHPVPSSLY